MRFRIFPERGFKINGNDIFAVLKKKVLNFVKINKYKRFSLIVFILILMKTQVFAYWADSSAVVFKSRFSENVLKTNDLCLPLDSVFLYGRIKTDEIVDPADFYTRMNRPVFKNYSVATNDYLQIYNSLPQIQKQTLVRLFAYYEEITEKELRKNGLPVELKFLAPALSGLNCTATGNQKKAGIWQLTHFQAFLNGLQVTQLVDERLNPQLATKAFVAEIKKNYSLFKTPEMAVIAYFQGNTKIRNTLDYLGDSADFNQILSVLPAETMELIGAFQASAIFFTGNKLRKTADPLAKRIVTDTVFIDKQLHFKQITDVLMIPGNQLVALNPQFRFQIVPGNLKELKLALPSGKRDDFILWQDSVYKVADSTLFAVVTPKIEYPPAPGRQYAGEPVKNLEIEGKTKIKYTLKSGDVLGVIAEEYDVSVEDLMYWNNIRNERKIQAGKSIDIFVDNERASEFKSAGKESAAKIQVKKENPVAELQKKSTPSVFAELKNGKKVEHVVKSGESPFVIAKKYPGVNPDDILLWNNISDARKIQIGQTLVIYLKN